MDPVSILDGVISNLLFAKALGIDKKLSSIRSVARAISSASAEVPFSDVHRILTVWVDCVDLSEISPGDRAGTQRLIAKYCEVASIAGVSTDELTAASVIERFGVHLDRVRRLDVAEHDARESVRHAGLSEQIAQSAAESRNGHDAILKEIQKLTASVGGSVSKLSPSAKNLASVEALVDAGLFVTARDRLKAIPCEVELDHADAVSYQTFSGICAYHLGDVHGAVQSFQRASDLKPESSKTASNLAAAYLAQGDYDKAIGEARRARSLSPNLAPINLIA
ncbi:MAG TPA: tetratricopeptide repeat protein, partial [Thermoanaerobaculia bacterium]|nr:tetratricopeptide repeat protein [Thermoanaerobaculia bacterium]